MAHPSRCVPSGGAVCGLAAHALLPPPAHGTSPLPALREAADPAAVPAATRAPRGSGGGGRPRQAAQLRGSPDFPSRPALPPAGRLSAQPVPLPHASPRQHRPGPAAAALPARLPKRRRRSSPRPPRAPRPRQERCGPRPRHRPAGPDPQPEGAAAHLPRPRLTAPRPHPGRRRRSRPVKRSLLLPAGPAPTCPRSQSESAAGSAAGCYWPRAPPADGALRGFPAHRGCVSGTGAGRARRSGKDNWRSVPHGGRRLAAGRTRAGGRSDWVTQRAAARPLAARAGRGRGRAGGGTRRGPACGMRLGGGGVRHHRAGWGCLRKPPQCQCGAERELTMIIDLDP